MDVAAVGSNFTPANSPASPAPASTTPTSSTSATVDTVTLSSAAQQNLAGADSYAAKAAASSDEKTSGFYTLAAIATDTSGQYSQDQQLDAYVQFMGYGSGNVEANAWSTTFFAVRDSAIGQKVKAVTSAYNDAAMKTTLSDATNNAQGIAQAQLDSANALSDFDRKVLYQAGIKGDRLSGGSTSADISAWLSSLQDQAAGTAAPDAGTPFAQNALAFYRLAAVVNNVSGKASEDDQLAAYVAFSNLDLVGMTRAASNLYSQTASNSTIGAQQGRLADQLTLAKKAGSGSGDITGTFESELNSFNSMSDSEQKAYFQIGLSQRYTSIDQYKAERSAYILLGSYLQPHLDEHGLASQQELKNNPTLAAAWKLHCNMQWISPQDMIDQVAALFPDGSTAPAQADAEKALATLKSYAAGDAPKTQDQKALDTLKQAVAPDGSTAVQLLKGATEAYQKYLEDNVQRGGDGDKLSRSGRTNGQPPEMTDPTPSASTASATKNGAALSLTA